MGDQDLQVVKVAFAVVAPGSRKQLVDLRTISLVLLLRHSSVLFYFPELTRADVGISSNERGSSRGDVICGDNKVGDVTFLDRASKVPNLRPLRNLSARSDRPSNQSPDRLGASVILVIAFPSSRTPADVRRRQRQLIFLPAMSEHSFSSDSSEYPTPEGSLDASTASLSASLPSIIDIPPATPSHDSALSSISDEGSDSDDDGDAEEEWQESLRQIELLISMVAVPFLGKWVGRRTAYWGMFTQLNRETRGVSTLRRWTDCCPSFVATAWAKFMTWKYPIDVVITNRKAFNIAGAVAVSAVL